MYKVVSAVIITGVVTQFVRSLIKFELTNNV